jgi:NAD(P)-dependent dehydrogenase (short-subunit alcohol dehydrogenase family)
MMAEAERLRGKVALISGAASGMGAAQARLFAKHGAKVVIGDVQEKLGQSVASDIVAAGGQSLFVRLDVSDSENWTEAVGQTVASFGSLNILVNCAGISGYGNLSNTTLELWDKVISVNQRGVFLGMKAASPELAKAPGSAIINICSTFGLGGSDNAISYHASKGAMRVMSKAAALELAPLGIRVNTIFPGLIHTPMTAGVTGEALEHINAAIPLGAGGQPDDVAYASLFLVSDEAKFITGAELVVDGGVTAGTVSQPSSVRPYKGTGLSSERRRSAHSTG